MLGVHLVRSRWALILENRAKCADGKASPCWHTLGTISCLPEQLFQDRGETAMSPLPSLLRFISRSLSIPGDAPEDNDYLSLRDQSWGGPGPTGHTTAWRLLSFWWQQGCQQCMGCWCVPSSELKILKTCPGHLSETREIVAAKPRLEFKAFTGGSDSFAFHYDFSFPVTYGVAKIWPFGMKLSNPGVCLRLNYFR